MSCSRYSALAVMSCYGCLIMFPLSRLSCLSRFHLFRLSCSGHNVLSRVLTVLSCLGFPLLALISWLSNSGLFVLLYYPACRVLAVLSCLSCSGCTILPVVFSLSCAGCPVLLFCSCLAALHILAVLFWLSCSGCSFLDVLSGCSVLALFCSCCPIQVVLFRLSWLGCPSFPRGILRNSIKIKPAVCRTRIYSEKIPLLRKDLRLFLSYSITVHYLTVHCLTSPVPRCPSENINIVGISCKW